MQLKIFVINILVEQTILVYYLQLYLDHHILVAVLNFYQVYLVAIWLEIQTYKIVLQS